jgi:Zn finger protein HypA/HybF involved in hydrogenase expression
MKLVKLFNKIDTVHGHCENCDEETILVAVVQDYYRCTNCGVDTKQYINGRIRYMELSEADRDFIRQHFKNG